MCTHIEQSYFSESLPHYKMSQKVNNSECKMGITGDFDGSHTMYKLNLYPCPISHKMTRTLKLHFEAHFVNYEGAYFL